MGDSNLEEKKNNLYFMNKNENNIELMTIVKIKQSVYKIYRYTKEDCKKYFKVEADTEYIGYVDDNNFYVINLNDGEFENDFKQKFESFMLDNSTDIEKKVSKLKSKISEYTSSNHYQKLFDILKN